MGLDEVKQENRVLQGQILCLQQERQQLLERVAGLENQVTHESSGVDVGVSGYKLLIVAHYWQ